MSFQPCSGRKDVLAFAVAATSLATETAKSAVLPWLERLSSVYSTCGLGKHVHFAAPEDTDCPLITIDTAGGRLTDISEQSLPEKLASVNALIIRQAANTPFSIVYIIVGDEECNGHNAVLIQISLRMHLLRRGMIPHIVPLSLLSRNLALQDGSIQQASFHRSLIERMAFIVYDRLHVAVQKFQPQRMSTLGVVPGNPVHNARLCPAPAFKLVPQSRQQLAFTLQWPPPALDILDRNRILHVAYAISADKRWLGMAAIDEKGEHHSVRARSLDGLDLKVTLRRVWNFAKEISETVNMEWRIVIVKASSMAKVELQAWTDLLHTCVNNLPRPVNVNVCCLGAPVPTFERAPGHPAGTSGIGVYLNPVQARPSGDIVDVEVARIIRVSHATHPVAIYEDAVKTSMALPIPRTAQLAYYSLASSFIFTTAKMPVTETTPSFPCFSISSSSLVAPCPLRGYAVHHLLSAPHPGSTYPHTLARHARDVVQSYVDLQALSRERWAMSHLSTDVLPWHLAAVLLLIHYDIEPLLGQ